MNPKPGHLTDILFKAVLGLLITTFFVVVVLVLSGNTPGPSEKELKEQFMKEQLWDLNARYVFVYPHPSELPEGVNLCVDMITPGELRDTVWLMPDHESAGY